MPEVFISTEENRQLFKAAIVHYLNGTNNVAQTKHDIRLACTYRLIKIDAKTFAKNIPLFDNATDETLDPDIIRILNHLKLPTHKTHYTNLGINSLYELLTKQKEKNLDYLVELIDESYPNVHWFNYAYRPLLLSIGVLSFSYLQPQYFWMAIDWIIDMMPVVYHWVYHYVVQLNNLPIIGMGMQLILILYYLNSTFEYGLDPSEERTRNLFFRTIAIALNFLAHLITYWAAGTLSWVPATIFIISSLVSIVESIYSYHTQKSEKPGAPQANDVHGKAWGARYEKECERNKHFFLIRLIYATTISSLVLAWTLLAPSVILTMAYMLSMWLAFLIKDYCISLIKHRSADAEQLAVLGIYTSPESNPAGKIEADKAEFQQYAMSVLSRFQDEQTQNNLRTDIIEILSQTPFVLQNGKKELDTCVRCYEKAVTPSPSAQSLSTSQYSMMYPDRRKSLHGQHTHTPIQQARLVFDNEAEAQRVGGTPNRSSRL